MAASTNTVTNTKVSDKILKTDVNWVTFLADTELTAEALGNLASRELITVVVTNDASIGALAGSDLAIKDVVSDYDMVAAAGNGADIGGDGVIHYVFPETTHPAYILGSLTLTITGNTNANAEITVSLYTKEI
ncbi:MAG: hypothetical protein KAS32_25230 [Candidatus Peribacteraceae bacterium]|nr:hypothetical protein [Candidatus Peribacteraceae bacterium]